jgi:hypothetical protein
MTRETKQQTAKPQTPNHLIYYKNLSISAEIKSYTQPTLQAYTKDQTCYYPEPIK